MDNLNTIYKYCLDKYLNCDILYVKELTERRLIMKKQLRFPQGFWWGAASSGPQTEGQFDKAHENVMDYWFRTDPEDFFNGVGPDVASDFLSYVS